MLYTNKLIISGDLKMYHQNIYIFKTIKIIH